MSSLRKPLRSVAVCLALVGALAMSNCATLATSLPLVIAYAQDGFTIIDQIVKFVDAVFVVHPDPVLQKKVDEAASRAKSALDAALRIASGAGAVNQAKIDEAFVDFRTAYLDLVALCGPLGVKRGPEDRPMLVRGGLTVPDPLALVPRK